MNSGDIAFVGEFAEADAAKMKISHIGAFPATAPATADDTRGIFRRLLRFGDLGGSSHTRYYELNGKPSFVSKA